MLEVIHGDMLIELPKLQPDSIDSVVCDPPYHLQSIHKRFAAKGRDETSERYAVGAYGRHATGFMGKQWDGGDVAFRPETWAEVYRVMKPGAHLLAFGGTRTYHGLASAIEAAGFEIRDTIAWMYGSGFPKSHDVSKAIDKAAGVKREPTGLQTKYGRTRLDDGKTTFGDYAGEWNTSAPAHPSAIQWSGWGTALKPAMELICVARKPLGERTVAANVLRYGTGAINVDGCRVPTDETIPTFSGDRHYDDRPHSPIVATGSHTLGRWPANVVHDGSDEVEAAFALFGEVIGHGDSSTPSRFFYTSKADKSDRLGSHHPTVKPVDLIRWLVRLVAPPGGTILDPFAGSGTTGMAAMAEGLNAVLIEREAEYVADINRRLAHVQGADTPLFQAAPEPLPLLDLIDPTPLNTHGNTGLDADAEKLAEMGADPGVTLETLFGAL